MQLKHSPQPTIGSLVTLLVRHRRPDLAVAIGFDPEHINAMRSAHKLLRGNDILIKREVLAKWPAAVLIPAARGRDVLIPAEQRIRAQQE